MHIAHLGWVPEATSDQQRLDRRSVGSYHVAQPEGGPSELGRRVHPYVRVAHPGGNVVCLLSERPGLG